ncbi:nuclear transport factor 2 family protein [Sphingomonas histidinilytica]|uniref:SnoaL-like domain-containing protein n=1 Tax=Rhizorhabdus histidinilytica TaxID=439228 RepID=A0A1T5BLT9_9SPHN|nr:nuclear transport factor 2 family protein [Rhizorhabdus histidinilytica]MBO9377401.1 nuclear transport factor 2 family protein [Rhizorhabdus histidinilytica]SKB47960.1 SnoaL-like domain-containing protein [Rhizorhabdus histidinilytica]
MGEVLEQLIAKAAVRDLIYSYPRGLDRLDPDLLRSIAHPGATMKFLGMFDGSWDDFVAWLMKAHTDMLYNRHTIGNVLIEVKGDRAVSETTATAHLIVGRADGQVEDRDTHSRYLDNWERRDGRWGLVNRLTLKDHRRIRVMGREEFDAQVEYVHAADVLRDDPSYAHFASLA